MGATVFVESDKPYEAASNALLTGCREEFDRAEQCCAAAVIVQPSEFGNRVRQRERQEWTSLGSSDASVSDAKGQIMIPCDRTAASEQLRAQGPQSATLDVDPLIQGKSAARASQRDGKEMVANGMKDPRL